MDLSPASLTIMGALAARFVAEGLRDPWRWAVDPGELGDAADELLRAELLTRMEPGGTVTALRFTDSGRSWALERQKLVVTFCPKCSTDEYVAKGEPRVFAHCHVCGVGWTEDTTVEPFVPTY